MRKSIRNFTIGLALVLVAGPVLGQPLAIQENFENFELGQGDGQFGWTGSSSQGFEIVDTGIPRFGARSARYVRQLDFPFEYIIRSPIFPGCLDCTLYADLLITEPQASFEVETYDVRGGIQNTKVWFRDDGTISAFQMDDFGQFLGVWHDTPGRWAANEIMRLGIQVRSNGDLNLFLNGTAFFEGDDMSADWPFDGPDTGIGRFHINGDGVGTPVGAGIVVDNINSNPDPPVGSRLTGSCPGTLELLLTDGTPGGDVVVFLSNNKGGARIPAGACQSVLTDVEDLGARRRLTFDGTGAVNLEFEPGEQSCGSFLQALDVTSCRTSALVAIP